MREQLAAMLLSSLAGLVGAGPPSTEAEAIRLLDDPPRALFLSMQPVAQQESIYRPPEVTDARGGYNEGALSIDIHARYMTDYIFRGLEVVEPAASEDSFNFQLEALLRMDLGRLPDPFFHVLTNTAAGDDFSNFQVIRPSVGVIWETEAFDLAVGTQTFTYPDRTDLDSAEVFVDLRINDGFFFTEEDPILGPFLFAAYDFDRYDGFYFEAGLRRRFDIPDTNLTIGVEGLVAYVRDYDLFNRVPQGDGTGFSHYQVGLTAEFRLNTLLNISRRYGQWSLTGHIYYTDGIDNELAATTQVWGGGGITFRY